MAFRVKDAGLLFAMDGKWGVIEGNKCFASAGLVVPSPTRCRTDVARVKLPGFKAVRLESYEFCSQFAPVLSAMLQSESTIHVEMMLAVLCDIFPEEGRGPHRGLNCRAVQMAKDFAKSLEAARVSFLPRARAVGDWSHYSRQLTSKATSAGIGREQARNAQQLSHRTRFIPSVELFSALWSCQFAYYDFRNWHRLRNNLSTDYFKQHSLESLSEMPAVRLLPGHQLGTRFWMADWFTGVLSVLPRSAGGSQCAEAFHSAWEPHVQKGAANKGLSAAFDGYQGYVDDLVATPFFQATSPVSLHDVGYDPRLFAADGLAHVGEITALDLWRFRDRGNFAVVRSPTIPNTVYVVFRQTPTVQDQVHHYVKDRDAVSSRLRALSQQRSRIGLGVKVRENALPLTTTDIKSLVKESWALRHPAAEPVDTSGASLFVQLLELSGDALQQRLHQLGVLRRPDAGGVDFGKFDEVMQYEVVILGNRAAYVGAPNDALVCSCRRFGYRHACGHVLFAETLDIEGFRAATIRDMAARSVGLTG